MGSLMGWSVCGGMVAVGIIEGTIGGLSSACLFDRAVM